MTREHAVRALRGYLLKLTDDETSLCRAASQHGIFCKGFSRFSDEEFRSHYHALVARRPGLTRRQLEYLANQWQLARQIVDGVGLSCDAQAKEHDTCRGWDEFTNEDLVRFCRELFGAEVTLVPAPPA
jgi:hypothetical protein